MPRRIFEGPRIKHFRAWIVEHRRHLPTGALVAGFIWDLLTLGRPDELYGNIVLLSYLLIAGGTIILYNMRRARRDVEPATLYLVLMQFCFGNLTSGILVFYGQSGTLSGNWPFLLLFTGLLVGNEFLRSRYSRIYFHVAVYFVFVLAYVELVAPILLRLTGTEVFVISAFAALLFIIFFVFLLALTAAKIVREGFRTLSYVLAGVFLVFNGLYFFNLIPPVPLVLKDVGVYHSVSRTPEDSYLVREEERTFLMRLPLITETLHITRGASTYCFSSVFSPTGLSTPVYHNWERYTEGEGWQSLSRIPYPILGGRSEGYRGFSIKTIAEEGLWRCSVENHRGALIGQKTFRVEFSSTTPPLVTTTK